MTERKHPNQSPGDGASTEPGAPKPRIGGLRLVASEGKQLQEEVVPQPSLPRRRSNLARFMDAYADAIDRDVKALLEL